MSLILKIPLYTSGASVQWSEEIHKETTISDDSLENWTVKPET